MNATHTTGEELLSVDDIMEDAMDGLHLTENTRRIDDHIAYAPPYGEVDAKDRKPYQGHLDGVFDESGHLSGMKRATHYIHDKLKDREKGDEGR